MDQSHLNKMPMKNADIAVCNKRIISICSDARIIITHFGLEYISPTEHERVNISIITLYMTISG